MDLINDKCGIFAIIDNKNIYQNMITGLNYLQHRGHDSAGISYMKNNKIQSYKALGFVKNIFEKFEDNMSIAIGHVRYSTCKKTTIENKILETQPIDGISNFGKFSLAHNGNIPYIYKLKKKYNIKDDIESDTIILIKIIEKLSYEYTTFHDILINIINNIEGVYCLIILIDYKIYALRDAYGVRPLCIGKNEKDGYCISSESNALQDYKLLGDINPGEIIRIDSNLQLEIIYKREINKKIFCIFEYIYFMRSESITSDKQIGDILLF